MGQPELDSGKWVEPVDQDRRINNCRYVEDAASIRVNAGSVGYDSY